MKKTLVLALLSLALHHGSAEAQRTDWTAPGAPPPIGRKMTSPPDARVRKRADRATRAKADSLRADVRGATVETAPDVNGLLAIRLTFCDDGLPAEPNVTGYNAATRQAVEVIVSHLRGSWAKAVIGVDGHTDNVGPYDENMAISLKRALAICGLMTRQGADSARISTRGLSYDYPIADNHLIEGREKNRRVEITLSMSPEMLELLATSR